MTTPLPLHQHAPTPGVWILTLEPNQGAMVVLDRALIERIETTLRLVPADARGFILASGSERVFIAGADLKAIQDLAPAALSEYLRYGQRVFAMIAALPCWTAAAISGAALGGGLEIAMHCDALIASPSPSGKPYPVGLPEASLSICPGWGGTNLLPARLEPADAIRRTATGETMPFDAARLANLFDAVAPTHAELIPTAARWIADQSRSGPPVRDAAPHRWIGRPAAREAVLAAFARVAPELPDTQASRAVRHAVRAGLDQGWAAALEVECRELTRLSSTDAGRAAIHAFFERSAKKA